jgi:hypothetical protein
MVSVHAPLSRNGMHFSSAIFGPIVANLAMAIVRRQNRAAKLRSSPTSR